MSLEDSLISRGCWPLCGVDEAGRGPLAGPVVAAAVIMEPGHELRLLVRDSKQLSHSRRRDIFESIMSAPGVHVGYSLVDERCIDEINILQAALKAMREAVLCLDLKPLCAVVDGNIAPVLPCTCYTVVRGDEFEPSISAASIVAKVIRDTHMEQMDRLYPGYGFARHKGYPTRAHYEAIRRLGACPIHRRSFRGVSSIDKGKGR
ncbi:MAG TPA: ribonuclease HII [Deltaproteobacteria bacterium]|jgi:ribonuclease HII|nr:ribonuclease HII [Deltaproteobacteria bacterium]HOD69706.1 ribonuclease HII [Deltaproteobacteria bacterium]HOE72034.1 ribonuclease HII [Deltaproteobacteria bacterium]HON60497.1 ribonuclease HII [Deltaproteobacteria bacterium]HOS25922.1 ribonuclease HII [Deltaproteobacteria bacterium]